MALRAGDPEAALERFDRVATIARERGLNDIHVDARWGRARATEALGPLETAISQYESLAAEADLPSTVDRAIVNTALCRAYWECGDLARAIDVGEQALQTIEQRGTAAELEDSSVALASTLAGCYMERGDLTRAHLLAGRALARAEQNGSPQARAAALWNAGLISEAQGDLRHARSYVERALALYGETDNARATALLRVAVAYMLLRETEPKVGEAEVLLQQALHDVPVVGSSLDLAYAETELARCRLLQGAWEAAVSLATAVLERLAHEGARLEAAAARLVLADAYYTGGDVDAAVAAYTRAAEDMRDSGARRHAASAWRQLAEGLARVGRVNEALDAYRAASDAVGIQAPPANVDEIKRSRPADAAGAAEDRRPRRPSRR